MKEFIFELQRFVTLTEGDDDYENTVNGATIAALGGNDTIFNSGATEVSIAGGAGNDYIADVYSAGDTLSGGNGEDSIGAINVFLASINGGSGSDNIIISGYGNTITGGKGNDYIVNIPESIDSTFGDYTGNVFDYTSDDGNDYISGFTEMDTLRIGSGNGTYSTTKSGSDIIVKVGTGNITLEGAANLSTVNISGETSSSGGGSEKITLTEGDDDYENTVNGATIAALGGNDTIFNSGATEVSIAGGAGDDYIADVYSVGDTLSGGNGEDSIGAINVFLASINGGANDDSVIISGYGNTIIGGKGNDYIVNIPESIDSTFGDYTGNVFDYTSDDGNDYIGGFTEMDTLRIGSGNGTYSTTKSGSDIIVNVGTGNITLEGAANLSTVNISGEKSSSGGDSKKITLTESADDYENTVDGATIDALGGDDYIYNEGASVSINGGAGADDIYNEGASVSINVGDGNDSIYNNGYYATINGGDGADTVRNEVDNVTINGGDGDDDIYNDGGNVSIDGGAGADSIYNRSNVVTISGGAGDDSIYNWGNSVSIDGGDGNDSIENYGASVTIDGGAGDDLIYNNWDFDADAPYDDDYGSNVVFNYNAGDGNDVIYGFKENSTLSISGGECSSTKSGDDIIIKVGTGNITLEGAASFSDINILGATVVDDTDSDSDSDTDSDADLTVLEIDDKTKSPVTLDDNTKTADASSRKKNVQITGNARDNSIIGGIKNDTLNGSAGDDSLTGGAGNDVFIYTGGRDVISDCASGADKISVASGLTYSGYEIDDGDVILEYGNRNSLTIKGNADKAININSDINYYTEEGIFDSKKKSLILSPDMEDSFSAAKYSKLVTIDGSDVDNDIAITGNKKANLIIAGDNGATLDGDKGNDTLRGGDGEDVFIYENKSGKDVIENYDDGDIVSLGSGATIKDAYIKSRNAIIKIGSGSITVKNSSEITFAQGDEETIFSNGVFINDDSAKVYSSFNGTIDLSDYDVTIGDASLAKKKVTVNGGDSDDSLIGGKGKDKIYGNAGDDTLSGGKGNDSLWGGDGADVFTFFAGGGTDHVMDYESGELLQILDKRGKEISGNAIKDATFDDGGLTLTINGGGKVIFNNIDDETEFNINGTSYSVSGSKLVSSN